MTIRFASEMPLKSGGSLMKDSDELSARKAEPSSLLLAPNAGPFVPDVARELLACARCWRLLMGSERLCGSCSVHMYAAVRTNPSLRSGPAFKCRSFLRLFRHRNQDTLVAS